MPRECSCPLCGGPIAASPVLILPERGMVVANGRFVIMPSAEMLLLQRLVDVFPRVLSKQEAMNWIYQLRPDDEPEIKIIDVYICKMRKKLEPLGIRIDPSWGRGYALATSERPHILDGATEDEAAA